MDNANKKVDDVEIVDNNNRHDSGNNTNQTGTGVKGKVWIYAVVLFTSAFIVLLLTGYSQIKFNKNMTEYKNVIFSNEADREKWRTDLEGVMLENKRYLQEIEKLTLQLADTKNEITDLSETLIENKNGQDKITENYENLSEARNLFDKGNILESGKILFAKVEKNLLGSKAALEYEAMVEAIKDKGSKIAYAEGRRFYQNKEYAKASEMFKKSLEYNKETYYSDDSNYYLAWSLYKSDRYAEALETLDNMYSSFPESQFIKQGEAQALAKIIKQKTVSN